jgi:pimeloyl-ACP methyl ester carboxylesterase
MLAVAVLTALLTAGCAPPLGVRDGRSLVVDEFMVDSEPGISIFVRNKRPAGMERFESAKTVVFVHGATYPSETSFDLALDGESWMDFIARKGYDVYLLDVRGYGRSTRPPQMDKPAQDSPPFAQTEEAVRDVGAVVDFVRKRRGIDKVNLLAWSWGTMIMPSYASRNNDKVVKLALYAPLWLRQTPGSVLTGGVAAPLPAYRTVTQEQAKARWLAGAPEDKRASLIPTGWFETWASATWATDPVGAQQNPPVLRAPNGVVEDGRRIAAKAEMPWKPEDIRVPVLLVKAEWDQDTPAYMAQTLFPKLINAPYKRYVEIGEGTHTVIMERNRMALFKEVQLFLDETP